MKSTTKRLLAAILSIAMVFTLLPATVFAAGKPTITQQPTSVTVGVKTTAEFNVVAEDAESYLWQVKKNPTSSVWSNTSFATSETDTLVVTATEARDGYQYRCKVTNASGSTYSQPATLTVVSLPYADVYSDLDVTAAEDTTARMKVGSENTDSYQWQYRESSTDAWKDATDTGNQTSILYVTATASRDGYQYRCKLTNIAGSVYSDVFVLTVDFKPQVITQPSKVTVNEDEMATFTITTKNADSYQWQVKKSSSGSWVNTSFATSKTDTLVVTAKAERNGYRYRCQLTNEWGTVYSDAATLNIVLKPFVITQPESVTANIGETAVFSVEAEGAEKYQWQTKTSVDGNWINTTFDGSTTETLRVPVTAGRNGYQYRCKLTGQGRTRYSSIVKLTVNQAIVIDTQPMSPMAEIGKTVSLSVVASSKFDLTYQWQTKTSATGKWINTTFTGSKTPTVKVPVTAARDGYQYRCKISNGYTTKYSDTVRLDVYGITKHPQNVTVKENKQATFSVTATGDVVGYKWQMRSSSTASWSNVSCTEATYTFTPSLQYNGYQYRCMVIFAYDGETVCSNVATLTVKEDENLPTLTWVTYPQTTISRTVGERLNIEAQIRGGKAPYTFEWKQTNYNGSETKYYRGVSSTGKGKLTKVCEKADFNSIIYLTITDAAGQTISCPLWSNVREFIPIAIRIYPDDLKQVVIDKDDSATSHFIDTRFSSTGSGRFALEWQYVCTKKSVSQLTDSDWTRVTATSPFSLPSYGNFAVTVGEGDALYKLMDSGNLYLRCKATDVERNDVAYTDILPVVYGEVKEEISDTP